MKVIKRKPGGRPRISAETRKRIVEYYNADDMSCPEIAKTCGVSLSSLHRIINDERRKYENAEEEA